MSGSNKELIAHLNVALKNQLTCVNQCFLHARMLKHQGQLALADGEYKESIDSMKFSDMLVEHILSLGGLPNLQELGQLMVGETLPEMLACDLKIKESVRGQLQSAIAYCDGKGEDASGRLLGKILGNIEEHISYIHLQMGAINTRVA
jgi:bacterioferritin